MSAKVINLLSCINKARASREPWLIMKALLRVLFNILLANLIDVGETHSGVEKRRK